MEKRVASKLAKYYRVPNIQKRIERALKAEYSDKEVMEYIDSFDIVMEIRKKAYEEGRSDQAELDKMLYGTVINPNLEKEVAESKLLKEKKQWEQE